MRFSSAGEPAASRRLTCAPSDSCRLGLLPSLPPTSPAPTSILASLDGLARHIRRCCRILKATCAGNECCFVTPRPSARRSKGSTSKCSKAHKEEVSPTPAPIGPAATRSGVEPLTLELKGMDCADCLAKVTTALQRLPSYVSARSPQRTVGSSSPSTSCRVNPLNLDYLRGLATLAYDPEVITPDAISRFVGRATGFGITTVGKQNARSAAHLTLPIKFGQQPPASVLDRYNTRVRTDAGGFVELSFAVQGDQARNPRDILDELVACDPQLVPFALLEEAQDRVAQDLRRTAYRTFIACLLSIPILVLAWAPLPERKITYGIVSLIFTTLIEVSDEGSG